MTTTMRSLVVDSPVGKVTFYSTKRGMVLSSGTLGVLLGYARPRNVRRVVVRMCPDAQAAFRLRQEYYLTRLEALRVLDATTTPPGLSRSALVHLYVQAEATRVPPPGADLPVSTGVPAPVTSTPAPVSPAQTPVSPAQTAVSAVPQDTQPLTPREQLQLGQVRVEQARFITALITARRVAKELTPAEHRRLAHKAAEVALGEAIPLDVANLSSPIAPLAPHSLGSIVRSLQSPADARPAMTAAPAPVHAGRDPFEFGTQPTTATTASPVPVYESTRDWIVSRFNPPERAVASELAYLIGYGCTRQKIGMEATRLGFTEGHPWVETKQVAGRHSNREDCTVYYYARPAALALIEAVFTNPTREIKRRLRDAKDVPAVVQANAKTAE